MKLDTTQPAPSPADLIPRLDRLFDLAARKTLQLDRTWDTARGTPVFTVDGEYTTRGWTEWTQGFQYGNAILGFDATGDRDLLDLGRRRTVEQMAPHVTHTGVHDHGFNNLSTYGNLRRLMLEGRIEHDPWEMHFYELALKASGAVQAARWSPAHAAQFNSGYDLHLTDPGYVYSFNGPQSLFIDTMRTVRILGVADQLGHALMGEGDDRHDLLGRSIRHGLTTHRYIVFRESDEEGGHTYAVRGRTAHEGLFNTNDHRFRARSTQQGYSPFSTWTRGLSWAMLGYAEELEFLRERSDEQITTACGLAKRDVLARYEQAARDTCDHWIGEATAADGVPYWDDGAPGLCHMPDWRDRPADPYNEHEPVDASAAAIAAQGLLRLGQYLGESEGDAYTRAGLSLAATLLDAPYLSTDHDHQGLLLHSVYHWPNGWDHVPNGARTPRGESSMWGDYHLLELAVYLQRLAKDSPYLTFFDAA